MFASLAAACVNAVFGLLLAWVLVRYEFPGRRFVDALIDLPFALPTAVSGIALGQAPLMTRVEQGPLEESGAIGDPLV